MTTPAQPTPGQQRAELAAAVGVAVWTRMDAAQTAVLGVVGTSVARVVAGASVVLVGRIVKNTVRRLLNTALSAALGDVQSHARTAHRNVTRVMGHYTNQPPVVPDLSEVERALRAASLTAYRDAIHLYQRAATLIGARPGDPVALVAAQKLLTDHARRGLLAFVDTAGRHLDLPGYARAASSMGLSRAELGSLYTAMGHAGIHLVIILSSSGNPGCPHCAPFEGRVLAVDDVFHTGMAVMAQDVDKTRVVQVVRTTVEQAVAAGLFHPSCRHFPVPFADGMDLGAFQPSKQYRNDAAAYDAQEARVAAARRLRRARNVSVVAVTPEAKARARRRVRVAREHVRKVA